MTASSFLLQSKLLRLKHLVAVGVVQANLARLVHALKMFNPDQPRDERGRWADTGGGDDAAFQLAQGDRLESYPIDLREEEAMGGHTIEGHVGKSYDQLVRALRERQEAASLRGDLADGLRVGSFTSLDSATRLVNSTIAQDQEMVAKVASGAWPFGAVEAQFGSVTGYEAYGRTERSEPSRRDTYGVRVIIFHDPGSERGYRVHTAFPVNSSR